MSRWWKQTAKVGNPQNSQADKASLAQAVQAYKRDEECRTTGNEELIKAMETARDLQMKLQSLQTAVRSIVLRLKVLDVAALEKDLGEDGTVPLRLALSELKELIRAYDGMPKLNIPDYGWVSAAQQQTGTALGYATTSTWSTTTAPYNQLWMPSSYSSSSSDTGGTP